MLQNLLIFLDELTEMRVKVHALQFLRKLLLTVEVAPLFCLLIHTPRSLRGHFIRPVLATCWT